MIAISVCLGAALYLFVGRIVVTVFFARGVWEQPYGDDAFIAVGFATLFWPLPTLWTFGTLAGQKLAGSGFSAKTALLLIRIAVVVAALGYSLYLVSGVR